MLILLSPAKNMNFDPAPAAPRATKPVFLKDTAELSETTATLTKSKIKTLMGISEKLADLNYERFQAFSPDGKSESLKQAALAFNGDVYLGLDANSLSADDLRRAQDKIRILSGLYGLLRPLDAIQPYRLEMGSRLKNTRGKNLYEFWGSQIAQEIDKSLKGHKDKTVVNLASNEYFSAVDRAALKAPVITPTFKEEKDGKLRQLQFYAKRARGLMARWAVENQIDDANDLKKFNVEGYRFQKDQSSDDTWLFTRPQPPAKNPPKKRS
ncbi:peroxide stress protein YaaA [Hyphococcus sp. DH-69]|uniref:peroxide stress protein YaaA n=1 Tax=Hyphococcus formosus TaxID=3143534 RepID=UPI00398B66CF